MESALPLLFLLGAAQGIFLAVALLFNPRGNRRANRYLTGYMLVFVVILVDYLLDVYGITRSHTWVRVLLWPVEFLFGSFIYLYCREMTLPGRPLPVTARCAIAFFPAVHIVVTWSLLLLPAEVQYAILEAPAELTGYQRIWSVLLGEVELTAAMLHLTVFVVLSIRLVAAHRRRVTENMSSLERFSLDWLRNLLLATLIMFGLWLFDVLGDAAGLDFLLGLGIVVMIYSVGWMGLRQPKIFAAPQNQAQPEESSEGLNSEDSGEIPVEVTVAGSEEKYARSALSPELASALMAELTAVMTEQKPYLNPDLSLAALANQLSVSTNYLSQTINQLAGQNFFDYINRHRVEHALPELLASSRGIVDIAMAAGFNSKSAFYAAFRKHQGMTPGDYRKRHRSDKSSS